MRVAKIVSFAMENYRFRDKIAQRNNFLGRNMVQIGVIVIVAALRKVKILLWRFSFEIIYERQLSAMGVSFVHIRESKGNR